MGKHRVLLRARLEWQESRNNWSIVRERDIRSLAWQLKKNRRQAVSLEAEKDKQISSYYGANDCYDDG